MNQQINLFLCLPQPVSERFGGQVILRSWGGVIVILFVIYGYAFYGNYRATIEEAALNSQVTTLNQQLKEVRARYAIDGDLSTDDTEINSETTELAHEIEEKSKLIDRLQLQQQVSAKQSFSGYLSALSEQIIHGLWLRRIVINYSEGMRESLAANITLLGVTVDPLLVPQFLQHLTAESAFSGRNFKLFTISSDKKTPSHINFVINTTESLDGDFFGETSGDEREKSIEEK